MPSTLTTEQIVALAPDDRSVKAGRTQASPTKWRELGADKSAVWGLCQGSGKKPYQTQVDLREIAFRCSCPSRKIPCKHVLGLLLLHAEESHLFADEDQPEWVSNWLSDRDQRAGTKTQTRETSPKQIADPKAAAHRAAAREARVDAGIQELNIWLKDLVRRGLVNAREQSPSFWTEAAARLVDAQAPGLARRITDLRTHLRADGDHQEAALLQLARLYLLVEAYERRSDLDEPLQADLRSLVGWTTSQAELLVQSGVTDQWEVLGQAIKEEGDGARLTTQRIWLRGHTSKRWALILHFARPKQPLEVRLQPGTRVQAELVFFPSSQPQRALIKSLQPDIGILDTFGHKIALGQLGIDYAAILACNPWLERMPVALKSIHSYHRGGAWYIQDEGGLSLPLAPEFDAGWALHALSGGATFDCFGEWNGFHFFPLSVAADGCITPLEWGR